MRHMPSRRMPVWSTENSIKQIFAMCRMTYTLNIRTSFLRISQKEQSIGTANLIECKEEQRLGEEAIEEFGRLSFESGWSSIYNWETGSPELKKLYEIMRNTEGIYGGRFSGAGFKGCCMALIDPAYEESIIKNVTAEYLKEFPSLKGKYSVHICDSADGVRL